MSEEVKKIENQDLAETVVVDGANIRVGQIKIQLEAYPLHEDQLDTLTGPGTGWEDWAKRLLWLFLGGAAVLIAKVIAWIVDINTAVDKNDVSWEIKNYEWISVLVSLILSGACWGKAQRVKNKKTKLIETIRGHYNESKNV